MKKLKKVLKWVGIIISVILFIFLILLIIPEKETIKTIQPRETTQYWEMNEGFKIAFTHLHGIDSLNKSPIVFLHGGPGGYVHSSIIETLGSLSKKGYDVYLYDQRGSGLSDRMEKYSDVSFKKHISDLHEIITEQINANKVILIGQSFGTIIISHFSANFPGLIEKIVFSSPGTLRPNRQVNGKYVILDSIYPTPDSLRFIEPYDFKKDVDNMALKPKALVATMGALFFDKKLISDKQMDRMLNTLASQFTKGMVCDPNNVLPEEGGGGLYSFFATNSNDFPEIRNKIKKVKVPILVIQGQCEYLPFSSAYEYVDLYPNSKYSFIENAGHEIWWEQKEKYLEEIIKFIDK